MVRAPCGDCSRALQRFIGHVKAKVIRIGFSKAS